MFARLVPIVLALAVAPAAAGEETGDSARPYATREERRGAGVEHELTDWLRFSGLLEFEAQHRRTRSAGAGTREGGNEFTKSVQLAGELERAGWPRVEVVLEYADDGTGLLVDEVFGALEVGGFELEAGRFYLPFGEYVSQFVSGPALEFGETRGDGAALAYGADSRFGATVFAYRGRDAGVRPGRGRLHWGAAVTAKPGPGASVGLSYISSLWDALAAPFGPANDPRWGRVAGLSGFASARYGRWGASAEFVTALERFGGALPDRDEPRAWNLELAFHPRRDLSLALRLEGSTELEEAPRHQAGVAANWRVSPVVSVSVEALRGRFGRGLAEDSRGRDLTDVYQVGGQLSVEF